jgi:hypothetical protein
MLPSTILAVPTVFFSLVLAAPAFNPLKWILKRQLGDTVGPFSCYIPNGSFQVSAHSMSYIFNDIFSDIPTPIKLAPKQCYIARCSGYDWGVCNISPTETLSESATAQIEVAGEINVGESCWAWDYGADGSTNGVYYVFGETNSFIWDKHTTVRNCTDGTTI